MAEIIFRLPSKKVQYGYVEIKGTLEELHVSDVDDLPVALANAYIDWMAKFVQAEEAAMKAASQPKQIQVSDIVKEIEREDVTPISDDDAEDRSAKEILRRSLGAHVVTEEAAPWDGAGDVPANLKPWEKKSAAPKAAASDDWDF